MAGFDEARSLECLRARGRAPRAQCPACGLPASAHWCPMGVRSISASPCGVPASSPAPGVEPTTPEAGPPLLQRRGTPSAPATSRPWASGCCRVGHSPRRKRSDAARRRSPSSTRRWRFDCGPPATRWVSASSGRRTVPRRRSCRPRPWRSSASSRGTQRELFEDIPRGAVYVPFAQGYTSATSGSTCRPGCAFAGSRRARAPARSGTAAPGLPPSSASRRSPRTSIRRAEYWALAMVTLDVRIVWRSGTAGRTGRHLRHHGVHGLAPHAGDRRTRGDRRPSGEVLGLIVRESLTTTLAGIAAGLAARHRRRPPDGQHVRRRRVVRRVDVFARARRFVLAALGSDVAARRGARPLVNPCTALRSE